MQKFVQAIIQWTPSGIGAGALIHYAMNQDWGQAVVASFLTGFSSLWVKFSSKFMEEAEKEAERKGETFAQWLFRTTDGLAFEIARSCIGFWDNMTSPFQKQYYQHLIYICRDFQTQGLDKDRVLKLEKVFVPLKIVPKDAVKISSNLIRVDEKLSDKPEFREVGDFLGAMRIDSAYRRLIILGAPGSGKTTLLRYLTLTYAQGTQHTLNKKAPRLIPILLFLRDIYKEILKTNMSLAELTTQRVTNLKSSYPLRPPSNWFDKKLHQNQCLVMLDGLDEIADEKERQQVSCWVDQQMQLYPDTVFILTSRPFGYQNAMLSQEATVLEVQPFTLKQMEKFIHSWYLQIEIMTRAGQDDAGVRQDAFEQATDLVERIKSNRSLTSMAFNPLLLTMIATVHRRGSALPGKRVELYSEICKVLLEKRQLAKKLPEFLSYNQKQSVLQTIALWLMKHKTRKFTLNEIQDLIESKLSTVLQKQLKPEEFLKHIKDVSGLLVAKEREGIFEFVHLSFQEYLASLEIKVNFQENLLLQALQDQEVLSWWAETIRLYAAQGDASKLIQSALGNSSVNALALAYDCLEEGLEVNADVRKLMEEKLRKDLESFNPKVAELAARVKLARRLGYVPTN